MRVSPAEEALLQQLRELPPELQPIVRSLVEFLARSEKERQQREQREIEARQQREQREAEARRLREQREAEARRVEEARLEGPLGLVWENADDAAYDRL